MSFRASDLGLASGPSNHIQSPTGRLAASESREPFKHVISLGCRCSQAGTFKYLNQRRYACPFDWIFSSTKMVLHCLRDDFKTFLDRDKYFLNATVFDAIGLKPGSAPRDRRLIGHREYSEMTEGVGRGSIFNHRDPMLSDEDYVYTQRSVDRFRSVLHSSDCKMFAIMNLNKQLWSDSDIGELFQELSVQTKNFVLIAVDCIRNLGPRAHGLPVEELVNQSNGNGQLLVYRLPCVGDNTGSYFRDEFDGQRIRSILIEPYKFALVEEPPAWVPVDTPTESKNETPTERKSDSGSRWTRRLEGTQGYAGEGLPPFNLQPVVNESCDVPEETNTANSLRVRRWSSKKEKQ